MTKCPYCDQTNIEGVDYCDQCGQPLQDQHLPHPASHVERGLLRDRLTVLRPKPPVVVTPQATVAQVLRLMVERRIGCVYVVEQGKAIGVFTERDALLRLNTEAAACASRPIAEFMTPQPETLAVDTKVAFAVQRMDLGGYRHVLIVDQEGHPQGVISVRDILQYLTYRAAGR